MSENRAQCPTGRASLAHNTKVELDMLPISTRPASASPEEGQLLGPREGNFWGCQEGPLTVFLPDVLLGTGVAQCCWEMGHAWGWK